MNDATINPASMEHLESFRLCLDSVARERIFIGRLQAPSKADMRERFEAGQRNGVIQDWALVNGQVVGWALVMPHHAFGLTHSSWLALGVHRDFRRQGIGHRLMTGVIEQAWQSGLKRLELEVWADNQPAITLYEKLGFRREGVLRNYRYLDGRYTDAVMMALLRE
ncbi:MAG: GNAT family N-acetyltransferase [Acidobacteria bacterium]|nr:GNAT family N-acetyltransferase [Acidobacteriota bacterium]